MPPSTTVLEPTKQAPMAMETSEQNGLVVAQPTAEPQPTMETQPQMSMRGGNIFCGFSCCDGSCRCHRDCC